MLNWQDIQINNTDLWGNFKEQWLVGNYANAISILQNIALMNKWQDANKINKLTSDIVDTENMNDATFKQNGDMPITSAQFPSNPQANLIWFEII